MREDLVLTIEMDNLYEPKVWTEVVPLSLFNPMETNLEKKGMLVAFSFLPNLSLLGINHEVIFFVETSEEMAKDHRLDEIKSSIASIIQSLNKFSYLQIVGFGKTSKFLFKESVPANPKNILKASGDLKLIEVDGPSDQTNLLDPLEQVLSKPVIKGFARTVFSKKIYFISFSIFYIYFLFSVLCIQQIQ